MHFKSKWTFILYHNKKQTWNYEMSLVTRVNGFECFFNFIMYIYYSGGHKLQSIIFQILHKHSILKYLGQVCWLKDFLKIIYSSFMENVHQNFGPQGLVEDEIPLSPLYYWTVYFTEVYRPLSTQIPTHLGFYNFNLG